MINGKSSSAPPPFYIIFFGKWARLARWCHAQVSQAGREAKRHDRVCGAGVVDLLLLLHLDKTPHFMHIGTLQQISHIHVASCSCTCSTIVRIALSLCSNSAQSLSTQRSSMHSEKLGSARKCRSKRSQGALPGSEVHGTVPRECARECNDVALRGWSSVTAGWEHVSGPSSGVQSARKPMHNKHKAPPSLDPTRFVEPSPLLVRLLSGHVAPVSNLFVVWDFLQFLQGTHTMAS